MGKLSKSLLKSFLLSAVVADSNGNTTGETAAVAYAVTGCNDEALPERPPALSFKIAKTYFDDNLSDQIDSFTLNDDGDFYERTIAENDLTLEFSSETDG